MWLSNTSTTAMVMPIVEAVLQELVSAEEEQLVASNTSIEEAEPISTSLLKFLYPLPLCPPLVILPSGVPAPMTLTSMSLPSIRYQPLLPEAFLRPLLPLPALPSSPTYSSPTAPFSHKHKAQGQPRSHHAFAGGGRGGESSGTSLQQEPSYPTSPLGPELLSPRALP